MRIKFLPVCLLAVFFLSLISSCQKEYSIEGLGNPATNGGTAIYSLKGSPDSCTGVLINGNYTSGTALGSNNYISVKVVVDSAGSYSINTNSSDGISFSANGNFTAPGEYTIQMSGSGTPAAAGDFSFKAGTNGCNFNLKVEQGSTQPPPASSDCKSCNYFPVCVGSKYTYEVYNNGNISTLKEELVGPEKDTTVAGVVYRKIYSTYDYGNGTVTSNNGYYNCKDNVTTVFAYAVANSSGTATIAFIKSVPLKANEPVGATWTDIITNQGGQTINMTFKIEEKNISSYCFG